jgi:hypothetical protein
LSQKSSNIFIFDVVGTYPDRTASPIRNEEAKNNASDKPKKLFVAPGSTGFLSAMIQKEKMTSGGRAINATEFAQSLGPPKGAIPGMAAAPVEEDKPKKKKRIRKKKDPNAAPGNEKDEDGEEEA